LLPLSLRSYGRDNVLHRHTHAQIVLPLQGGMDIDVGGRGRYLDGSCAAFVAPMVDHAQSAQGVNRFLILDCTPGELGDGLAERWQRQTFLRITPALRRLMEFIDLSSAGPTLPSSLAAHCAPLLLASLSDSQTPPRQPRLAVLLAHIEAAPEQDWCAARMAAAAQLSVSRLHALFRTELGQTPQQWLVALRLRLVREWLEHSDVPLAELALRAGYADQSALTRAMRRVNGITPAAYRKQQQQ